MIWPSEWREVKCTPASKFKQLWVKLPSGIWLPTDKFICDAQMMPPIMGGSPGTVDKQVGASADDRTSNDDDTWNLVDVDVLYAYQYTAGSSYRKHTGARFTGLGLSQGVTIDVAYAEVDVDTNDDPACDIYCEDQESPPNFGNGTLIHDRTRTTASAEWAADNIGTGWKQSPSLVGPIQEIATDYAVDTLVLLFIGKEGAYKQLKFRSYDYTGNANGPKLHIEYTAGGAVYYHGLKVQGEGELALCDAGLNPLRFRKGGVTYGIELVATDDPNASRIRIKTPTGIKAIRKYT